MEIDFSSPSHNLKQFGLGETLHIADLGAGSGHYTRELARVLKAGKVYAIEVQKEILERLKNDLSREGITNVEYIWANMEKLGGTKLADGSLDAAVISNVLFQIEDKITFIREVKRILKPSGRVLLIDWSGSHGGMGPVSESVVTKDSGVSMFEREGFKFEREINAGANHWGVSFVRN